MNKEIILTEEQRSIVDANIDEMLIRGIAGSGKTLVILKKAKKEAETYRNKQHAIISYNKTLTKSAEQQIEEFNLTNLKVSTFHSWAFGILTQIGKRPNMIPQNYEANREILIKKAKTEVIINEKHRFLNDERFETFISDEIKWIKGLDIKLKDDYMDATRTGRGSDIRLSRDEKGLLYSIYEAYEKNKGNKHDYEDFAILISKNMNLTNRFQKFDTVFVDEAQDLSLLQLKVLRQLTNEKFIVAADKGQKIYKTSFTWKQIGLEFRGQRTKILNETFRSTKEIVQLAMCIQRNDSIKLDEEFIESKIPKVSGPLPIWCKCMDFEKMKEYIVMIARYYKTTERTLAVIGDTWKNLGQIEKQLGFNGLYPEKIKNDAGNIHKPGIKLTTYYSSKGLEFDAVIMMVREKEFKDEDLDQMRRLFYVVMTRAKSQLIIVSREQYPDILDELDKSMFKSDVF